MHFGLKNYWQNIAARKPPKAYNNKENDVSLYLLILLPFIPIVVLACYACYIWGYHTGSYFAEECYKPFLKYKEELRADDK